VLLGGDAAGTGRDRHGALGVPERRAVRRPVTLPSMGVILLVIVFVVLVAALVVAGIRMSRGEDIYGRKK
jgi:hypothetical protein